MPYVTEDQKIGLDTYEVGESFSDVSVGELTYVFYRIMLNAMPSHSLYEDYHKVLGAVEAAKLEFYRRHVAPYEDKKIEQNGDVV